MMQYCQQLLHLARQFWPANLKAKDCQTTHQYMYLLSKPLCKPVDYTFLCNYFTTTMGDLKLTWFTAALFLMVKTN